MAVNATHPEYDANLPTWLRARDVLAGEDAVKAGGEKYLPRLDDQTDAEYAAYACQVDEWRRVERKSQHEKEEWKLMGTRTPLRLGKPLPLIPFVFHGPRNFLSDVDKLPLADVIAVNLDHYRLDADYKHGMHFTALPTAWVSGRAARTASWGPWP